MEADFWHQRWEAGHIAFHEREVNPLLVAHFAQLGLHNGSRVFLPLCGKTHDIAWLLSQGSRVVGAELSQLAIDALFVDLDLVPDVVQLDGFLHYRAPQLDIFVGDIFKLTHAILAQVDAVYDRAALVALPLEMRTRYAAHLRAITHTAPQLLIALEYDQSVIDGPPFSVDVAEVLAQYAEFYQITVLAESEVVGGLKGKVDCIERVSLLTKR